jgi:hypothetical protein
MVSYTNISRHKYKIDESNQEAVKAYTNAFMGVPNEQTSFSKRLEKLEKNQQALKEKVMTWNK